MHGGGPSVTAGQPLAKEYKEENVELVVKGCVNLQKHIENAKKFGVNVVVAVNKFQTDTTAEIEAVKKAAMEAGAYDAVLSNHWAEGGAGAADLAAAVVKACEANDETSFKFLYDLNLSIKEKVEAISKEIYGADGVDYSDMANKQIEQYEKAGFGGLPICIAKTQYSFSCDASAKGVPTGFRITVREIRSCAGAGFLYPICGDIMTVPGLSTRYVHQRWIPPWSNGNSPVDFLFFLCCVEQSWFHGRGHRYRNWRRYRSILIVNFVKRGMLVAIFLLCLEWFSLRLHSPLGTQCVCITHYSFVRRDGIQAWR
jgi:formyltetrahydrofolate synthetase